MYTDNMTFCGIMAEEDIIFSKHFLQHFPRPGAVARSEACSLGMQAAPSSKKAHSFVETWS